MRWLALLPLLLLPAMPAMAYDEDHPEPAGPPMLAAPKLVLPLGSPPQRGGGNAEAESETYEKCMRLARQNPAGGRDFAQAWMNRGGAHPAGHCFAVALIGLKQYKEAGGRLEKLAEDMLHAPAALRAEVLGQAAQAWVLAGDAGRAYEADGRALGLAPGDVDLLVDRAEAAGMAGWFDKALPELDRALKLAPTRIDALIYRASAHRALGHLDQARADAEAALHLAPDSAPALLERGNIESVKGNLDAARQDWARAAKLAPDTATGTAAKANVERLNAAAQDTVSSKPGKSR